jgi:hypothetical protein
MLLVALALLTALATQAQEFRATLSGQVTDPQGALVVDATVTAVNVDSGTSYTARTTKDGTYYIPYVLPGTYTVTATAQGFKTAIQDKVRLFAAQGFGQNFKLELGGATEKVEVTSAPPELETTTGSGGQLLLERELQSVPLGGRNVFNLIGTTPGSQVLTNMPTNGSWSQSNNYSIGGGAQVSYGPGTFGGTGSFNQFTLNGINITQETGFQNATSGAWNVSPNLDTVDQVNVMTTNYDARYGQTAGGTVNVVTKGGGNKFHGDLFENYGGAIFEANNFQSKLYGIARQGYVENHYDGTFGGPIKKNKLFFFFGFEGYNFASAHGVTMNVPPAYLRPGFNGNAGVDFGLAATMDPSHFGSATSQSAGIPIYEPGTSNCPVGEGTPANNCNDGTVSHQKDLYQTAFPGYSANGTTQGNIPASMINSTATAILKYIPLPNLTNAVNYAHADNYYVATPHTIHYYQPTIRVDYNLSDKTKLYSYYEWQTGTENQNNNGLSGLAANGLINEIKENWSAGQDVTHTFSSSLLLDAKVGFARNVVLNPDGDFSLAQAPSILGLALPLPGNTKGLNVPEFTVSDSGTGGILGSSTSGDSSIFGNNMESDATTNVNLDVDLTWIKKSHSMHIGGSIADYRYGDWSLGGHPNGNFGFNSGFTRYNPTNSKCYSTADPTLGGNKCNNNMLNGSGLADFYLGYPNSGGIDWNAINSESEPTYAVYFQDDWRVNHRLTLNLGFRYDVERGLRDKHNALNAGMCLTCVNPVTNNANFAANIASASNIAAWKAAGITPPTQALGGQLFPGVNGQSQDAYYTDWSNFGPRIGFAYAINSKTVVRGGWGLVYQLGLEGGSNAGFGETTPYTSTRDSNVTPNAAFKSGSPFAGVTLIVPPGSSQGLLTNVGNDFNAYDFPQRKLPRDEVFSLGFQRELPGRVTVDARYAANYSYKNRTFLWLSAANTTLSQWNAAIANPSIWADSVPNPYYGVSSMLQGGSGCGTSKTVAALDLLAPLSQYCSGGGTPALVGEYNAPIGKNWYNGLEVKVNRHVYGSSRGLFFQVAYTWSKTINGQQYGFGWPFQGSAAPVPGGVSSGLAHIINNNDRDQVLAITPVWDLPIGKGSLFFPNPNKLVGLFINGWTLSSMITVQSGWPVGLNNGVVDSCPLSQLRPSHKSMGEWLTNDAATITKCWSDLPSQQLGNNGFTWGLQTTPGQFTAVRQPSPANIDISFQKSTTIREGIDFILRMDAFNAFNTPQFGGPDNSPDDGPALYTAGTGWTGFGTIGPAQQNSPRIVKVSGKITF